MVPREVLILCLASSCDKPSMSTSLKASTSANWRSIGSGVLDGLGMKPVIGGMLPKVTGFGNLPLPLYLCLPCHITGLSPIPDCLPFLSTLVGSLFLREPTPRLASLLS
jgi:hypothetical protein